MKLPDHELLILRRIVSGPLPIHSDEAQKLAPLSRYQELKDADLFDGAVILDGLQIDRVIITGITHAGRQRLAVLEAAIRQRSMPRVALRWGEKAFWIVFGFALRLLAQWLSKVLGLK